MAYDIDLLWILRSCLGVLTNRHGTAHSRLLHTLPKALCAIHIHTFQPINICYTSLLSYTLSSCHDHSRTPHPYPITGNHSTQNKPTIEYYFPPTFSLGPTPSIQPVKFPDIDRKRFQFNSVVNIHKSDLQYPINPNLSNKNPSNRATNNF